MGTRHDEGLIFGPGVWVRGANTQRLYRIVGRDPRVPDDKEIYRILGIWGEDFYEHTVHRGFLSSTEPTKEELTAWALATMKGR